MTFDCSWITHLVVIYFLTVLLIWRTTRGRMNFGIFTRTNCFTRYDQPDRTNVITIGRNQNRMNKAELAIALKHHSNVEDAVKFIEANLGQKKTYSFVVFDDESMLLFNQDDETFIEVILKPKYLQWDKST